MKDLVCVVDLKHWWRFFTPTFEHVVLETPEIVVSQPELGYHGEIRERADLYLRDEVAMETDEGQGRHTPEVGGADDVQVVVVEVDSHSASRDVSRDLKYYNKEGQWDLDYIFTALKRSCENVMFLHDGTCWQKNWRVPGWNLSGYQEIDQNEVCNPFSIPGKFHPGTLQFFCQQVPSMFYMCLSVYRKGSGWGGSGPWWVWHALPYPEECNPRKNMGPDRKWHHALPQEPQKRMVRIIL